MVTDKYKVEGPEAIVATANGDPLNFVPFPSHEREAFNGLVLVVIRSIKNDSGLITVCAKSRGLNGTKVAIRTYKKIKQR